MFSTELSNEITEILETVTPNFEENLKRAFKNKGVRNYKFGKNEFVYSLDDVLFPVENTIIELRNLRLPWVPDFRICELFVNLEMLCLDVNLSLGSLRVEGDYEANNSALQDFLPLSHNGKIWIIFDNVAVKGRIGLLIQEDSLMTENYDIVYDATSVSVRVSYYINVDNEVVNEICKIGVDETLGKTIWVQLNDILTSLLKNQLGEVVLEFSLEELFIGKDNFLRDRANELNSRANRVLDLILCSAKDDIVAKSYRQIITPGFDVTFKGKPSGLQLGNFHTAHGYIEDLSSLTRTENVNFFEDDSSVIVYGYINLRDFKHGYLEYISKLEDIKINGSIKASINTNNIFVKILLSKESGKYKPTVLNLEVRTIKNFEVDVSGLASLSWLQPKLNSWVIGNLRHKAVPVLETCIRKAFEHAIINTNWTSILRN